MSKKYTTHYGFAHSFHDKSVRLAGMAQHHAPRPFISPD